MRSRTKAFGNYGRRGRHVGGRRRRVHLRKVKEMKELVATGVVFVIALVMFRLANNHG